MRELPTVYLEEMQEKQLTTKGSAEALSYLQFRGASGLRAGVRVVIVG